MSEDKKKMNYYYGGKEKSSQEIKKRPTEETTTYSGKDLERDFYKLMRRFESDFEDFWGTSTRIGRELSSKAKDSMRSFREMPSVDIEDQGKSFRLTVDLPGFKKEDVQVELMDDFVTINAQQSQFDDQKRKNYVRHERSSQTYYRRIQLPESVLSDDAKATLIDGVLEINLPKKAPKESKRLNVT